MPREHTQEEIKEKFLQTVWMYVDYWHKESRTPDTREKLEGLAFSLLVMLDGGCASLPGFIVAPSPHEDDKQYCIDNDENYFPQNHESDVKCDIAGGLHDMFHNYNPKRLK